MTKNIHGYTLSTVNTPTITPGITVITLLLQHIMLNTTLMFVAYQMDENSVHAMCTIYIPVEFGTNCGQNTNDICII